MTTAEQTPTNQSRIVLGLDVSRAVAPAQLAAMLQDGSAACVIIHNTRAPTDEAAFQTQAAALVPVVQAASCAAIIAGDSRIAGRLKADGLHIESDLQALETALDKRQSAMMVGYGNLRDRHSAMQAGEKQPDYLLFGRLGHDTKDAPHNRNLTLGEWWASMMEIPCIVQGGNNLETLLSAARTGAEFIMLEEAVFSAANAAGALKCANDLLASYSDER